MRTTFIFLMVMILTQITVAVTDLCIADNKDKVLEKKCGPWGEVIGDGPRENCLASNVMELRKKYDCYTPCCAPIYLNKAGQRIEEAVSCEDISSKDIKNTSNDGVIIRTLQKQIENK